MRAFISNLADARNHPGRWGMVLSAIVALWWCAGLLADEPGIRGSIAVSAVVEFFGRFVVAGCMGTFVVLAIAGIGLENNRIRMLSATAGGVLWLTLLVCAIRLGPFLAPGVGIYLTMFIACAYADVRLARYEAVKAQWISRDSGEQS